MKTAADLKRGHTQWGEDDPLRSARPSEQGRREARAASRARDRAAAADAFSGASLQARKELLYRSYHPQLVSLTAQQRCAARWLAQLEFAAPDAAMMTAEGPAAVQVAGTPEESGPETPSGGCDGAASHRGRRLSGTESLGTRRAAGLPSRAALAAASEAGAG